MLTFSPALLPIRAVFYAFHAAGLSRAAALSFFSFHYISRDLFTYVTALRLLLSRHKLRSSYAAFAAYFSRHYLLRH